MLHYRIFAPLHRTAQPIRFSQRDAYLFRHDFDLHQSRSLFCDKLANHHHKFVSTKARHCVRIAYATLNPPGDFNQQQIANIVPVLVVKWLEVVHIQEHQRTIISAAMI